MTQKILRIRPQFKQTSNHDPSGHVPSGHVPPNGSRTPWSVTMPGNARARPPILVRYMGTMHPPIPTNVSAKVRQERLEKRNAQDVKNQLLLEQAIFILSQSETGRDVLTKLNAAGYRIVFDNHMANGREAGGLCDSTDKRIILHGQDSPLFLALLLGHESVHAMQASTHDLFPSSEHMPDQGIKISFAIEADAYAQQTQIALELTHGDRQGPENQLRYPDAIKEMRKRFPDLVEAAEKMMALSDQNLSNGSTVAAAFEAFYDNYHLRSFYEDSHMGWVENVRTLHDKPKGWLRQHFNHKADADHLKKNLQHKGKPYLKNHLPNMDLNDARHSGLTPETIKRIHEFYKSEMNQPPPAGIPLFGIHTRAGGITLVKEKHLQAAFKKKQTQEKKKKPPTLR